MPSIGGLGGQWVRLWSSTWAKTAPIAKPGNAYFLQLGRRWVRSKTHPETTRNSLKTIGFCKPFTGSLTTGADAPGAGAPAANTTGTAGADTFNAFIDLTASATQVGTSTLTGADVIRGNAGIDTLNVSTTINATGTALNLGVADISGVEVFIIRDINKVGAQR